MRRALLAAVIAGLGAAPSVARATEPSPSPVRHVIAMLDVVGPTPDAERGLEDGLAHALRGRRDLAVRSRKELRAQLRSSTRWTDGCVAGPCLLEIWERTGVRLVLLAAVTGSGTTFGYVITLVRTDTGRVAAQVADRCDVCTEAEALEQATAATVRLAAALPEVLPAEPGGAGGAAEAAMVRAQHKRAADRRRVRRTGWALTLGGLAVAGVGTALYLAGEERPAYGLAAAAAGGGLAASGVVVLTF